VLLYVTQETCILGFTTSLFLRQQHVDDDDDDDDDATVASH